MNAQVLTTSTSAVDGSLVSVCPARSARPSITSESTRFFGQPSDTRPIFIAGKLSSWRTQYFTPFPNCVTVCRRKGYEHSMKHVMRAVIAACAVLFPLVAFAQGNPNLAGTWTLDRGATPTGRGAGGINGIPLAGTMIIKLSPASVTVEADTGSGQSMQAFVYKLDGSTNAVPGSLGWDTKAKAAWEGDTLVVTTQRSMQGPTGVMGVETRDVYSVSGDTLTIERSLGRAKQKLIYKKGTAQ